jgi:hypothetical protein
MDEQENATAVLTLRKWLSSQNYLLRWRYVAPAILVLWLYASLGTMKGVVMVSVLALIASYSTIYKRVVKIPSAIEFVTLGTVTTAIAYGPVAGALFGVITTLSSEIISAGIDVFTIIYMFARGVIGVAAFYMQGTNIVMLGVLMALLFNIICQPIYQLPGDIETKIKGAYYFVISILFNFLAFFFLGGILKTLAA